MPKEGGNPAGRRPSSRTAKPYDANNSFVKKMATKVTDFIPQPSWISKWFITSQNNEDTPEGRGNIEETEFDDDVHQPPTKRSRIRMDVIHPPGTFSIQTRVKTALNTIEPSKEQYPVHEVTEDFLEPATAGPSGIGRLISSTPAVQADIRAVTSHRSDLNSLASSTNNGIANGMDDNSESSESTSGCSSLIPQINRHEGPSNLLYSSAFTSRKRHDDKLTFTNHLQSSRSLFLDSSRDSLSSRRPSFNASIITNATDRASPLSSPFYNGNITFGGANAAGLYKRNRNIFNNSNEIQLKVPRRTNVEVKPSDSVGVDSSGMSQTAKRILEALEHFSSPVSDAKKIPLKNTNNVSVSSASSVTSRKRAREEVATPSARIGLRHLTRELTVPTVPDILKLRRRQKLQDTTLMARKIVSARSDPPPPPQEYRLRTEDTDNEKYRGKLKGKSKINLEQEETVTPVNLPNIPLPITTLPNFNFTLPPPAAHSAGKTAANKENTFTFASPIKVTDVGKNLQSVNNFTFSNPINAEDCASTIDSRSMTENEFTVDCAITSIPNFIWSGSSTAPRLKAKVKSSRDDSVETTVPQELKSKSVMDVFKSNKMESKIGQSNSELDSKTTDTIKTASTNVNLNPDVTSTHDTESSWECSECMIRNDSTNKQCTACKIARSNPNKTSLPSTSTIDTIVETKPVTQDCFGSQFKLSTNQWECTTCCIRNKQSDVTCIACTTPKPGSNATVQQTVKSQNFDLMKKFKPAEGSWECSGCLLRNAANMITCPCCNTSKPTTSVKTSKKTNSVTESFAQQLSTNTVVTGTQEKTSNNSELMNKFKPNKDSWECPGCFVRNNNSIITCPCCSTAKPNSAEGSSKAEQTSTNGFGDKFKKPEGAWTCDSCLLQNDAKHTECVACQASKPGIVKSSESSSNSGSTLQFKFGVPSSTANLTSQSSGFKFGIDKTDTQTKSDSSPLNGFKFGNTQQNSDTAQFTFGVPKEENKAVSEASKTNNVTSSSGTGFQFNVKNSEKLESKEDQENKQETLFGMPKSESLTTANEKQTSNIASSTSLTASSFTFGMQKSGFNQPASNKETQNTSFATTVTESSKPSATIDAVIIPISTNTTLPSLSTEKNITKNVSEIKPESIFSFGVPSSTSAVTTTSTNATTTCLPTFAQPTFTFSDSKNQPATLPSFGQIPPSSVPLSTNVSFGGNKASEITPSSNKPATNDPPVATLFPIVSSSTPLFNNESKTTIAFGTDKSFTTTSSKPSGFAMPENKIPTFGNTEITTNKPPIFGTSETKLPVFNPPAANPLPTFGTPSTSATPSLFGSSSTPAFGNNTTPVFGGTSTTPTIFSTTKPNETNTASNSSLFTFGSASSQQSTSGRFNFSANVNPAAPATAKPLFTFGSNSSASPSGNNTFGSGTFGVNSAPIANTANFTFNPSKQETSATFGQGAVASPIFGTPQANPQTQATSSFSSTPSSTTGFNFGSTAPVAATSGGFNFGGMSSTSASTGGFNFNPTPTSTPTVAFDPNSRPSFNFTKGSVPTAFNAPPQSAQAPRKIKKAFRRCVR